MTYPNLSDEEIQKLRDVISDTLGNMRSDIRKEKLKVFGKTLLSLMIVAGGVATLIAGNNGILGKTKKIREKSKERKKNKEEVRNMDIEQSNRKWAKNIQSIIYQQENVPEPSAPLYPNLN